MHATIGLFRNATDAETIPAGTVLFREGDEGHEMFVVVEGEIALSIGDRSLDSAGPGEVLGEMALVDGSPRSATAVAAVEAKLVRINERRFQFLVQQTPQFALQVMRVMADRLRRAHQRKLGDAPE